MENRKYLFVRSKRMQNYLEQYGLYPSYWYGESAYYLNTPKLSSLLDRYFIKNVCIPNRL